MFEGGDRSLPILLGFIHQDDSRTVEHPALGSLTVREDDEHLEIQCGKAIRLKVGDASIVLTPKGRIVLRGKYVLTRASVTNRIRGGSVRIN